MGNFVGDYEWEEIKFDNSRSGGRAPHENEVWFLRVGKTARPTRMNISHNLTEELCWSEGDRVQLYKLGKELFALKPHKAGLITLMQEKDSKVSPLYYTNANMCLNFQFEEYGTVFDAWIDDDALFFKPKK